MLLQSSVAGYTDTVAYGFGALIVLATVAYWAVTRRIGREDDEASHEKATGDAVDRLAKTRQVSVGRTETDGFSSGVAIEVQNDNTVSRWRYPHTRLLQWARRRLPVGLVAHAMPFTDGDGRTVYLVSVNGRRLAHRDSDALLEDVETVAQAIADDERVPATFSEYYYRDLADGYADLQQTRARVRGDCKTRIQSNMRRKGTLPRAELVETLVYDRGFRYPRDVVEEKLRELVGRDIRRYKDGTLEWQRF